ncbi:MAG TPA: transposase [Blastocatellia bacterium]|nr:transposase [Blastocatellia bacterium]
MTWNGIREKPHRLHKPLYRGEIQCSFTSKLQSREKYFASEAIFRSHEQILLEALTHMGCEAHIYLFMPDHLHVVIEGTNEGADVRACMSRFKQRSGYALAQLAGGPRWQKDFYDHIIRNDRELRQQLNYILLNPVRAGLAASWRDYPYWGSTIYSREQLIQGVR